MRRAIGFLLLLCMGTLCRAQNTIVAVIRDGGSKELLPGATAFWIGTGKGAKADANGVVTFSNVPEGQQLFSFGFVGYKELTDTILFPRGMDTLVVLLEATGDEMGEVVISSTRSNRAFRNQPTRVEFINGEELEEKGNMKPGDIRMMLSESTGIQTQQVSATSANSSIRIQGLDGRYTQILKDGFPLYAGFSGGLGLLQIPPLDLKQVEIIKGSSSTLYGGGAIAGLVNLISKVPAMDRELRFLVNGTSAGGLDVNGFYGQRWGKVGLTLYGGRSSNAAYDPSGVGFSAIPKFDRYVLNPKLFVYFNPGTKLSVGLNTGFEHRIGGDMQYLKGRGDGTHSYFERNKSERFSTQLSFEHQFNGNSGLTVKNSITRFNRTITIPGYVFDGRQWSGYSEVAYNLRRKNMEWVAGLNVYTDDFKEHPSDTFPKRNYGQTTAGGFIQHTWTVSKWLQTETGLRGDFVADYGFAVLPRASALFKLSPALTSRIGGGLGYKTPTIFTEETERIQFQSVLPVSPDNNRLERSYGVNGDINYRAMFFDGKVSFAINQLFFFTRIHDPLVLDTLAGPVYRPTNSVGYLDAKGFETNIKLGYRDFKLYIGYTFTDAHLDKKGVIRENPLTVRHRLNNVLLYEKENKWKLGLEAYYFSREPLNDGKTGKAYWTFGFMAEKIWERFSLFINFENFTDTRQTRFDTIYTGTVTHPVFRDIYAPLDGFVVNGGVKVRL
jgi:outer membrane cobalamin receptor